MSPILNLRDEYARIDASANTSIWDKSEPTTTKPRSSPSPTNPTTP